jgi:hypothetical protein
MHAALTASRAVGIDPRKLDAIDAAALEVLIEGMDELKPISKGEMEQAIRVRYRPLWTTESHLRDRTYPKLRPLLLPTKQRRSRGQRLDPAKANAAKAVLAAVRASLAERVDATETSDRRQK